jgi:DNA-binding IclR family transcriptional regulator
VFGAWLPPAQTRPILQRELDARKHLPAGVETLDDADALLADVRSKGVAAISGNYMFRGVEAVAAPVFNFKNELTMSIVLVGVEGSIDMRDESPVIAHLKDAAHSLSQRLGSTRETAGPP